MSYMSIIETSESPTLRRRVQAAAAQEMAAAGVTVSSIEGWVAERMLRLAATSGWADSWAYAQDTYTPQFNPDTGARPDVISDGAILAAVQPEVLALVPEESEPATAATSTAATTEKASTK